MSVSPLVIYIPGLKPKPEPELHREQLLRCLTEGVRRLDPVCAAAINAPDAFRLISWTYDFYGQHRDISLDLDDIDLLLGKTRASEDDIRVATSWRRRFLVWLFSAADYLPFLVPSLATNEIEVHLRDYYRYVRNDGGIAEQARAKLKTALVDAAADGRPVLLLAHSMGSVIAWDALWQLTRDGSDARVDLWLTTGSPLGQKLIQRHLFGRDESAAHKYPQNIGDWVNIAAIGELTALDRRLGNDFKSVVEQGCVRKITDIEVFNYYRMHGTLNVHAEYGYLINEATARCVSDWWRTMLRDPGSA